MWKGVKAILKHLSPCTKTPQVTRVDIPEFSFLSGFKRRWPVILMVALTDLGGPRLGLGIFGILPDNRPLHRARYDGPFLAAVKLIRLNTCRGFCPFDQLKSIPPTNLPHMFYSFHFQVPIGILQIPIELNPGDQCT
ncbi:hypothetical protein HAX54_033979 [Datura stramonium]|uniref:Uncharacterized protein n=1 Tax=Datura stramonium TaxID=4076 RepID=A0ABS8VEB1_DATST|nr:hypothetical protein [Datura stramonium]